MSQSYENDYYRYIEFFKLSEIKFVKVPNLPEFKVSEKKLKITQEFRDLFTGKDSILGGKGMTIL